MVALPTEHLSHLRAGGNLGGLTEKVTFEQSLKEVRGEAGGKEFSGFLIKLGKSIYEVNKWEAVQEYS